jgi:hypothetical protein
VNVNKRASPNSLSPEDRAAWRRHNLQTLAESSALPFEQKMSIPLITDPVAAATRIRRGEPLTADH